MAVPGRDGRGPATKCPPLPPFPEGGGPARTPGRAQVGSKALPAGHPGAGPRHPPSRCCFHRRDLGTSRMSVMPPKRMQIITVGKPRTTSLQCFQASNKMQAAQTEERRRGEPARRILGAPSWGAGCGAVPGWVPELLGKSRRSCGSQTSRKPRNPALTALDRPCPCAGTQRCRNDKQKSKEMIYINAEQNENE